MKFLVTGGAGFLGINLVRYLIERGHDVVSLDIAEFAYPDIKDKITVINGDIDSINGGSRLIKRPIEFHFDLKVGGIVCNPDFEDIQAWR